MAQCFDYVIVGGGSAGSVLAGRLSEDPEVTVCLLEAGDSDHHKAIHMPIGFAFMVPTELNNWAFETVPQAGLNGRKGYQPRGKVLGGSSSINAMLYVRGHQSDYDDWANLGNSGWAFDDVLPYFKKAEHNERLSGDLHGQDGPLNVADQLNPSPLSRLFVEAGRQLQYAANGDFNGKEQDGFGIYQVTQKNGERCSAAKAYLTPNRDRPNLNIITNARATKINFEGRRATGVSYLKDGEALKVDASAEVISAAGAFQSPQLLMLSGVGPGAELQRHGIEVRHDLAGVGQNLQDHLDITVNYLSKSRHAFARDFRGNLRSAFELLRYRLTKTGLMTTPFAEAGAFLRTDPGLSRPDIQLHFSIGIGTDHGRTQLGKRGVGCHVCLLRPQSRGEVRLASADASANPEIDPMFLSQETDLASMIKAVRLVRRVMTAPPLNKTLGDEILMAEAESDADIAEAIRQRADTIYHPVGTCKMGSDALAVVDAELKVHGLDGLRMVDASIMPTLVGGNTNAPSIMIGEKAADMIKAARQ